MGNRKQRREREKEREKGKEGEKKNLKRTTRHPWPIPCAALKAAKMAASGVITNPST